MEELEKTFIEEYEGAAEQLEKEIQKINCTYRNFGLSLNSLLSSDNYLLCGLGAIISFFL